MSAKNDQELAAKLTDFDGDRYDVVVLASMYAKELKKKQEFKNKPTAHGQGGSDEEAPGAEEGGHQNGVHQSLSGQIQLGEERGQR